MFTGKISALGYRWKLKEASEREVLALRQRLDIPEILARVLIGRGIPVDGAEDYLAPTLRNLLPDPFHLLDMDKAAARLAQAITSKETIAIFGDYDVDGATSSALLVHYLRHFGLAPLVHIPDRMKEGYGPNAPALLGLKAKGASVIITVDCGTAAHEPLAAAHDAGVDVLVIDHHIGDALLPKAYAVVNPNRFDEISPHKHMAAVGVTFLLIVAVNKLLREQGVSIPNPLHFLDIVALGTVADVVSLTGINRAFVSQGLKLLSQRRNIGLAALADVSRMNESASAYHLGFLLGPRINAGGRVGKSDLGVRLLATHDPDEAAAIAKELDLYNDERKTLESLALEDAMQQAEMRAADDVIVVAGRWHAGVIGIVAGRIKEKLHKPTAVIALENGIGKASARSVSGVDFGSAIVAAKQAGILLAGGGHVMAAGFTVEEDKIEALRAFLCTRLAEPVTSYEATRALMLDAILSPSALTVELIEHIQQAEPFGMGNPSPKFALPNMRLVKADVVGENHLRCIFTDGDVGGRGTGARVQAMAFRALGTKLGDLIAEAQKGMLLHIVGQAKLNSWQGNERVDFHIEDAIQA